MSLWTDFRDSITRPFKEVGEVIQDTVKSVLKNPIGAITSVVAMSYGIPPTWAGALGGAAGAAASGGNIVKAAITGGAMGAIGQYAGSAAAAANLGPIAQAAITGGAAGVTGAILTGQDVVTALKSGLVLGTVAGGVQQFMTPQEAISKIPTKDIAAANLTNDPIGALAKSQGWYDSVSATTAASQAIQKAKSDGSLRGYYADQIPDEVLAQAQTQTNPVKYVADEMGWSMSGTQVGGIYDALDNYTPPAPTAPTTPVPQAPVSQPGWYQAINEMTPGRMMEVLMPDGNVGIYDAIAGNTYDLDGNNIISTTPRNVGPGTQVAQGPTTTVTDVPEAPPIRIDISGGAGMAESPSYAVPEFRTPNTNLATQSQIDSGVAQWNSAANAWEVPTPQQPVQPIVVPEVTVTAPRPTVPVTPNVPIVVPPTSVTPTAPSTGGMGTGTTTQEDNTPEIVVTAPRPTTPTTPTVPVVPPVVTPPPLTPPTQVTIPEQPKIPEVQIPENTNPTTPTTPPIVPIVVPTDPNNPDGSYRYGRYTVGDPIKVNVPTGLNPGWMAPTPFYQNTRPEQAQYYWGGHPYQPGPEFNAQLYNTVPAAPSQPWGSTQTQLSATPQQIIQAMGMYYPLVGSTNGPVRP